MRTEIIRSLVFCSVNDPMLKRSDAVASIRNGCPSNTTKRGIIGSADPILTLSYVNFIVHFKR